MVLGGNVPDKVATLGVKLSSPVTFSKRTVTCPSSTPLTLLRDE